MKRKIIVSNGWLPDYNSIPFVKLQMKMLGRGLAESKRLADDLLEEKTIKIEVKDNNKTKLFIEKAAELSVIFEYLEDKIFEEIKTFLIEDWGLKEKEINYNTNIEKDLKITGDDAEKFIVDFGEKFNVDVSQFKADKYFDAERMNLIDAFLNFLFKGKNHYNKPLYIKDLIEAIKLGYLK